MKHDPLPPLRAAAAGLVYPSESDAPFEAFAWPRVPGQTARQAVAEREGGDVLIQEMSADAFFGPLAETEDADRFAQLRRTLDGMLQGLTVVRAGEGRVGIYLIGRPRDGGWAGLHTTSVET